MFNLLCLIVTAANFAAIGVDSSPVYFVGGEMELNCRVPRGMDLQKLVCVITQQYGAHPPVEILTYRNGSIISSQGKIVDARYRARVSFRPPLFRLQRMQLYDKGLYKCLTEYEGFPIESEVLVDVKALPSKAYTAETTTTVAENGNYSAITCVAAEARPAARIRWVETDTNKLCDFVDTVEVDKTNDGLTYTTKAVLRLPVRKLDGSKKPALRQKSYTCVVTHLGRKLEEKVVDVKLLYVPGRLTISIHPRKPNGNVLLQCTSTCIPKCNFTWFLNGKFHSSGSKLYLRNVSENEALNSYRCTAENKIGSASRDIRLPVVNESVDSVKPVLSNSPGPDDAGNWVKSIILYVVVPVVALIVCVVLIVWFVKKRYRSQKLTYAINGSESTNTQRAVSNDDVDGFVGNGPSNPVSPDPRDAPGIVEETLDGSISPSTTDFYESQPTDQNSRDDVRSPNYGYVTMDRRFSSFNSRNRPLPLLEPTQFSTLSHKSTRFPMSRSYNTSQGYSRHQNSAASHRYMPQPSVHENRHYEMTAAQHWTPRNVGSILSVRPSHPDEAMAGTSLTVATEV